MASMMIPEKYLNDLVDNGYSAVRIHKDGSGEFIKSSDMFKKVEN